MEQVVCVRCGHDVFTPANPLAPVMPGWNIALLCLGCGWPLSVVKPAALPEARDLNVCLIKERGGCAAGPGYRSRSRRLHKQQ